MNELDPKPWYIVEVDEGSAGHDGRYTMAEHDSWEYESTQYQLAVFKPRARYEQKLERY